MRRGIGRFALLVFASFSLVAASGAMGERGDGGIGGGDVLLGNHGDSVSATTSKSTGGQSSKGGDDPNSVGSDAGGSNRPVVSPNDEPSPFENCLVDWDSYRGCWQNSVPGEEAEPKKGEDSPGLPPITITDLATFSPAEGTIVGEPDSLGVVGLPANFVTEASPHVRSGDLFGFPVEVRFTPVSYTFHYGDGESTTSSSPGASWKSLGQAQFTPTGTSHTYSERGTYDARVDIAYTAEIDLGVGWFPIEGQLDIPGPTQQIRIFEAHTALVARTCAEQPSAPGC
ncbi:hypothetical protein GCM10010455_27000 [Microbacterium esteraromaticum]